MFYIIIVFSLCSRLLASDPSTLDGKVMFGYQGWFNTPSDGAKVGWRHWSRNTNLLNDVSVRIDLWPDLSEYPESTLEVSNLIMANGSAAKVFSSYHPEIQDLHFNWLKNYSLDGVFLQRFLTELNDPAFFKIRNQITTNVRNSAEKHDRTFAIMYDISGSKDETFLSEIMKDWNYLVNTLRVTESTQYQKHNGKPVVSIWGNGFTSNAASAKNSLAMVDFFKKQGCFVMGGVPFYWRTLTRDSRPDFADVYKAFDVLSPWAVGRFSQKEVDSIFNNVVLADKQMTLANNQHYAPVLFPGFSWANMNRPTAPFNQIPRNGGEFFMTQAKNYLNKFEKKNTFLYLAMFDEIDEGTAFFKAAPSRATTPVTPKFITMDVDGYKDNSDRYLELAGQVANAFKSN